MEYRELLPPDRLLPLVKLGWTLSVPSEGPEWFVHSATPDGCLEIVRRLGGRSQWRGEQPDCFVAGMLTGPAELLLSAGSSFVGLRLWPWAWRLISGKPPGLLTDSWVPLQTAAPAFQMPAGLEAAFEALAPFRASPTMTLVAEALPSARSPAELGAAVGLPPRALQRWFERNVGQPARSYLRMVRFSEAFAEIPLAKDGLADHAAGHGFADQAHMAREFRSLAGAPPRTARKYGHGPFLDPNVDRN